MTAEPPGEIEHSVIFERPGVALVAEAHRLVVGIDLHGLAHDGGRVMVSALERQRRLSPRPRCVVSLAIVGEHAPAPDAVERRLALQFGEHSSVCVCIAEGTSIRARWVRGIVGSVAKFAARRTPAFITRTIDEAAPIVARELALDPAAVVALLTTLRAQAERGEISRRG